MKTIDWILYTPATGWTACIDGKPENIDGLTHLSVRMLQEAVQNLPARQDLLQTYMEIKK